MGYEIHITRRNNWSDFGPPAISLAEWKLAADQYNDFVIGDVSDSEDEDAKAMCRRGACRYFFYSDGQISVKKPTRQVLLRMCEIAKVLNVKVIGDDGETYNELGVPDKTPSFVVGDNW